MAGKEIRPLQKKHSPRRLDRRFRNWWREAFSGNLDRFLLGEGSFADMWRFLRWLPAARQDDRASFGLRCIPRKAGGELSREIRCESSPRA